MTRLLMVNFRLALMVAWVLATTASILVGFAAVGSVRTAIAGPGSFRLPPDASATRFPAVALLSDPGVDPGLATTTPATDMMPPTAPSTTGGTQTTDAGPGASPSSPAPSAQSTTTTTTATAPPSTSPQQANTYEVEGGWVTLESDDDGVYLESASSKPGWTVKTEGEGPEEVVVVFKRPGAEIHFVAKFVNGQVRIEIED